jgi:hypothetical protein
MTLLDPPETPKDEPYFLYPEEFQSDTDPSYFFKGVVSAVCFTVMTAVVVTAVIVAVVR